MSRVVEAVYEKGVLRPLEKLDLEEGEKVLVHIDRLKRIEELLKKYTGILGKASSRELVELEIEAHEQ